MLNYEHTQLNESREVSLVIDHPPTGRREKARRDKQARIKDAARMLFAQRAAGSVTTREIADRAGVAIGTLFCYVSSKAELLIMVQNEKFAAAIDAGLTAAANAAGQGLLDEVLELIRPVIACVREHKENGRCYLHELVFGDPNEQFRSDGLALAARLEAGIQATVARDGGIGHADAFDLARVISAIIHVNITAKVYLDLTAEEVLADIRKQIAVVLHQDRRDAFAEASRNSTSLPEGESMTTHR